MASPAVNAALRGRPDWFPGASFGADFTRGRYKLGKKQYRAPTSIPGWTFSRASTGYAETAAGLLVPFGSGEIRRTDKGLLVEEARTNLLLRSQEFDNASWAKVGGTVTANAVEAPDGTVTADLYNEDGASSGHGCDQSVSVTISTAYTISVYAKYFARRWIAIIPYNTGSPTADDCWFDIQNGVRGTVGANATSTMTALGGGWYRCTVTLTAAATGTLTVGIRGASADGSASNYTGLNGGATYLWGAQLEAGAFPTSYIPTTTASATRAADIPTINPFTPNYAAGTLFVQATPGNHTPVTANYAAELWSFSGGTSNNVNVNRQTSSQVRAQVYNNGVARFNSITTAWANATRAKVAISYKPADYRVSMDGGTVQTASTAGDPIWDGPSYPDALGIGHVASSGQFNGYIEKVIYYPRAFSSAELQAATTPDYVGPTVQLEFNTSRYVLNGTMTADVTALSGWTFSRASTGYAETVAGTLTSFASGAPRITDKGLLVEEARTNYTTYSNGLTAGTGNTLTAAAANAPDGTLVAQRLAKTDATTPRYCNQSTALTVAAATIYTASRYFKYDGYSTTVSLEYNNTANFDVSWNAQFTVASTGVTVASASACTSGVQTLGDGWYRCWATFTSGAAPTGVNPSYLTRIAGASGVTVLTAFGQLEIGAFVTSYIPTTTASATRAADVPAISSLNGVWPHTVVAEWMRVGGTDAATFYRVMSTSLAGVSCTAMYQRHTTNVVRAFVSGSADAGTGVAVIGAVTKAAARFEANNTGISLNGAAAETDVTVTALPYDKLHPGVDEASARQLTGYLRRLIIYPYAFTDAQLVAAST